ncbi:hypothetical protein E2C01_006172 [Portunus trituberculatus]|uniref:Uncharacterized protein n=1 Tax=Portunus trituberculatus TaxID=210409 RepID=A0A5B7CUF0_PORTR|nr:hypothetical protein [Portunus trituberculatus]
MRTSPHRCWQTANEAQEERELDPRNFNNVRATSCREIATMNAWRDGNDVAFRLLETPPLEISSEKKANIKACTKEL